MRRLHDSCLNLSFRHKQFLAVTFNRLTGEMMALTDKRSGESIIANASLLYYHSMADVGDRNPDKHPELRASGAYIFRPNCTGCSSNEDACTHGIAHNAHKYGVVRGEQVQEVHVESSAWTAHVLRLYNQSRDVELQWTVGPIPFRDGVGREVIVRFSSDLASNGTFFTDANGRQLMRRVRNKRPTWNLNLTEPIAANYYPITTAALIADEKRALVLGVLTDRAQGASSLADGQLELMVCLYLVVCFSFHKRSTLVGSSTLPVRRLQRRCRTSQRDRHQRARPRCARLDASRADAGEDCRAHSSARARSVAFSGIAAQGETATPVEYSGSRKF